MTESEVKKKQKTRDFAVDWFLRLFWGSGAFFKGLPSPQGGASFCEFLLI